mmetsp:Transcript_6576/g.27145  ORF Transcript_6576/g.27145 Transcript_6576/m.27145 type:complete len:266 (+) Transcript_6576:2074-2871(+)
MPEHQLQRQRQPAVTVAQPIQRGEQALPPAPATQPGEARRRDIAAQRAQVGQQAFGAGPGQRQSFLVHDRVGKAGLQHQVTDVVHVPPVGCRTAPAVVGVEPAQFDEAVRPEAGEHHEASNRHAGLPAGQQARQVVRRVQRHVGPEQLDLGPGRQRLHTAGCHAAQLLPPALGPGLGRTRGQHRHGLVPEHLGIGIGLAQHLLAGSQRGCDVQHPRGLQLDQGQALGHPARHLGMQPGRLGQCRQAAGLVAERGGIEILRAWPPV